MDTPARTAPAGTVVVAANDSDQSRGALAWAAAYARRSGVALHAVHVVRGDFAAERWTGGVGGAPHTVSGPKLDFVRDAVQTQFDEEHPRGTWTLTFLEGIPGAEIVRFAARSALLVVGTRDHRGIDRLRVGSVSHYCLNHSVCPVLAVPFSPRRFDREFTWVDDREEVGL